MQLHQAWSGLIQKVEEENPDLVQNVALNLIRLFENSNIRKRTFFPLNLLSLFGDLLLVKFIIENNMVKSLSKNCDLGRTPVHCATYSGHTEIVKALIECPENLNAPDNDGWTPIFFAAGNGHIAIVNMDSLLFI